MKMSDLRVLSDEELSTLQMEKDSEKGINVDNVHVIVGKDNPIKEDAFDPDSENNKFRKTRQDLDKSKLNPAGVLWKQCSKLNQRKVGWSMAPPPQACGHRHRMPQPSKQGCVE